MTGARSNHADRTRRRVTPLSWTLLLALGACSQPSEVFTVTICADTVDEVTAVDLVFRRAEGFAEDPDVTLREGAFIRSLTGPFESEHRFALENALGSERVFARVHLSDGCEWVSLESDIGDGVHICTTATERAPALALGDSHTCALTSDGRVTCFGNNDSGQIGSDISDIDLMIPALMCPVAIPTATHIAAGEQHTCALLDDGTVRCWGSNENGRLGLGRGFVDVPLTADPSRYPAIQLADVAVDLVAGPNHTCAILQGRQRIQCWGDNSDGQLGVGDEEDVGDDEHPLDIAPVDLRAPILALGLGSEHTCVVIEEQGERVRCWGEGSDGQLGLGDGSGQSLDRPPVTGQVEIDGRAIELAVGYDHSCVIRQPDNEVVCWGRNQGDMGGNGYLGYGDTNAYGLDHAPDTPLTLPERALQLAAGNDFTCAMLPQGEVRCWGRALRGRLGAPDHEGDITDTQLLDGIAPVAISRPGEQIDQLVLGRNHACVVLDDDAGKLARCWGDGESGQLGNGDNENIGNNESPLEGGAEFEL